MTTLRYPAVLFDVGGTLIGPRESYGAVYARVIAAVTGRSVPAAELDAGLRSHWREVERSIPRGVDRYRFYPGGEREYWLRFVQGTLARTPGVPIGPGSAEALVEALRDAFREPVAWIIFDDVVPVLRELTDAGARLAVVSNWDSRLPSLLERLGLARWFGAVSVSHHVGHEKPRPEPFLHALEQLGADSNDALHVGDTPELDDAGATAAGIASVRIDRGGESHPDAGVLCDLRELPSIVRGGRS